MSSTSTTIGTKEWKEASRQLQIYAFNPAVHEINEAQGLSSRHATGGPSVSLLGKYRDEPLWDDLERAIERNRAEQDD